MACMAGKVTPTLLQTLHHPVIVHAACPLKSFTLEQVCSVCYTNVPRNSTGNAQGHGSTIPKVRVVGCHF